MDIISEIHKRFLIQLLINKVDFILIGGYAVIYHGYPRVTTDMDIFLKPDNENKLKLLSVLKAWGILEDDLAIVANLDFKETLVFHVGKEKNKIDFLTKIVGVTYEEADRQKVFLPLKDKQIPVIHYHHLITTKMLSNRLKDKADVEELQQINKYKTGQ